MRYRSFYFIFCFFFFNKAYCQSNIDSVFFSFKNLKHIEKSKISFCVVDLDSGNTVFSYKDSLTLPVASIMKVFTTASGYEILGRDYAPSTSFFSDKNIDKYGVLNGDLFVKGGADISIGSYYFNKEDSVLFSLDTFVNVLYSKGLRTLNGNLIGDGSAFGYKGLLNGWFPSDAGNYYGAIPSGLSVYDNSLRFYFNVKKPNTIPVLDSIFPKVSGLKFTNFLLSRNGVGDGSFIHGMPYNVDRIAKGFLESDTPQMLVKGSLPDPEFQFMEELKNAFFRKGIVVNGFIQTIRLDSLNQFNHIGYNSLVELASVKGRNLNDVVYWTNLKSVNVFAESIVSWIANEKTSQGSVSNGAKYIKQYWDKYFDLSNSVFSDGSGLSSYNRLSARNFCDLLTHVQGSSYLFDFESSLPIAGKTGTLKSFCLGQPAEGNVKAKSGTMKNVKSFAGYVYTKSGKKLAFTIIVNDFNCSSSQLVKTIEPIMNALYLY